MNKKPAALVSEREKVIFDVTDQAWVDLEKLSAEDLVSIQLGIAEIYRKMTEFAVVSAAQSFLSKNQAFQLHFMANHFQTYDICGYPVQIEICEETYKWTLVGVGEKGELAQYNVVKIV